MKRKQIIKSIFSLKEIDTDYTYGDSPFPLEEMITLLTEAKEKGANGLKFTGGGYEGIDWLSVEAVHMEKESDKDYQTRVAEAKRKLDNAKNAAESREKALYENLKLKYDKQS